MPFQAGFFEAVPRALFMEGRGKANSEMFRTLIELQRLPTVFMSLTMTAVSTLNIFTISPNLRMSLD